jgi:antitoxin component YwqK of YwqJK toxin-antitoxin module
MEDKILCYLCYDEESQTNPYLKEPPPCECKGSIVIHDNCLQEVIKSSRVCTICKTKYKLHYLPTRNGLELVSEVAINGDITEYTIDRSGDIQGEHTVKKQTGELISKCNYKDGLLDGEYTTWYSNGQVECICMCVRNKIHGIYQAWYDNGVIMEETLYKEGVKHGLCKRWDKEGNLIITRHYINGELPLPLPDEFDSD